MTENEIIDFLEDEINGLKEQKYGDVGEIAAEVFKEINGDGRIKVFSAAISALKEVQQYREIGTVEECREAVEKLTKAEKAFNAILSGNYNDECNFCVHNNNPMANCQCISGDGSWCTHNAKWNSKISDIDSLEAIDDGTRK